MNEIRFSCTNCGQHMTADPAWSGIQVKCPRCKADVTVPPAAAPPTIPPAYEPSSGVPPVIATHPPPLRVQPAPPRSSAAPWLIVAAVIGGGFLLLIGIGLAALLFFKVTAHRQPAFPLSPPTAQGIQGREPSRSFTRVPRGPEKPVTTDPLSVEIPSTPVSGALCGTEFLPDSVKLEGGMLKFGQGGKFTPDSEVLVFLFGAGANLAGKTWTVPEPESNGRYHPVPHVHFRWKDGSMTQSRALSSNYAMRLELGEPSNGIMPGKIYLELPEPYASKLTGTFEARMK